MHPTKVRDSRSQPRRYGLNREIAMYASLINLFSVHERPAGVEPVANRFAGGPLKPSK